VANHLQIGVNVDDLRMDTKRSFREAAALRFSAVEFSAVQGELTPRSLSGSGRRHLSRFVDGLGMRIASLVADVPRVRLTDSASVDERVERTRQIIDLAAALDVPLVSTGVGALTDPQTGAPSSVAVEALQRIGEFADARNRMFAIRPAHDDGGRVAALLEAVGCPSLVIGIDPAALVMAGLSPLSLIERAAGRIPLMYARDATVGGSQRAGTETRLGEGDVDMIGVVAALHAADYQGPYILRRMDSQTPLEDLEAGRERLIECLPPGTL